MNKALQRQAFNSRVVVISAQKSVLTTGVMVTLALIPSMSPIGMGLVAADAGLMVWRRCAG